MQRPHDLASKSKAYDYFAAWGDDGTLQKIVVFLREIISQREAPSFESAPAATSIDSQTDNARDRMSRQS